MRRTKWVAWTTLRSWPGHKSSLRACRSRRRREATPGARTHCDGRPLDRCSLTSPTYSSEPDLVRSLLEATRIVRNTRGPQWALKVRCCGRWVDALFSYPSLRRACHACGGRSRARWACAGRWWAAAVPSPSAWPPLRVWTLCPSSTTRRRPTPTARPRLAPSPSGPWPPWTTPTRRPSPPRATSPSATTSTRGTTCKPSRCRRRRCGCCGAAPPPPACWTRCRYHGPRSPRTGPGQRAAAARGKQLGRGAVHLPLPLPGTRVARVGRRRVAVTACAVEEAATRSPGRRARGRQRLRGQQARGTAATACPNPARAAPHPATPPRQQPLQGAPGPVPCGPGTCGVPQRTPGPRRRGGGAW